MRRYHLVALLVLVVVGALMAGCHGSGGRGPRRLARPFFAMDTGTRDAEHQSAQSQAQMLKELGYAGIGHTWTKGIPEVRAAMNEQGLRLCAVYINLTLQSGQAVFNPDPSPILAQLEGQDSVIWFNVKPVASEVSESEADELFACAIRKLADQAKPFGVKLAVYPHFGGYVEKMAESVRLARKVDRDNVGVSFNLCHWLRAEPTADLEATLRLALPYLVAMSINGADTDATDWAGLIQPLGRGDFDMGRLLALLDKYEWAGPVGLQGFGIQGPVRDNLAESMRAWVELTDGQ